MTTRLNVNINDETAEALQRMASDQCVTVTETVRRAVSVATFIHDAMSEDASIYIYRPDGTAQFLVGQTDAPPRLRLVPPIDDLIEASSLGTPEAKALRATITDEQAARAIARADELQNLWPHPAPEHQERS